MSTASWNGNAYLPRAIAPASWNTMQGEGKSILEIDDYRTTRQNLSCWGRMTLKWKSEPSMYSYSPDGEIDVRMLLQAVEERFETELKIVWMSSYGGTTEGQTEAGVMVFASDNMDILVRCEHVDTRLIEDYKDVPLESVLTFPETQQKVVCVCNTTTIFTKLAWAHRLAGISEMLRDAERVSPDEPDAPQINIVSFKPAAGFLLRSIAMEKWPKLDEEDLAAHYGQDFLTFHRELVKRLEEDNKGIFLFHGDPGTGKTYYIRRLTWALSQLDKTVVLIPRSIVDRIQDPSFTEFMLSKFSDDMGRKNGAIFLVEDAESVMQDRTANPEAAAATSALLNLTDGILNDIFPIQVIATFNMPIEKIDPAVLRSGRLGARKCFRKLNQEQAKHLASRIGVNSGLVEGPMTLSDVYALRGQEANSVLIEE